MLEEYDANRPLFETNKKLREELAKVTKQRDNYERELVSERMALGLDEYTTSGFLITGKTKWNLEIVILSVLLVEL